LYFLSFLSFESFVLDHDLEYLLLDFFEYDLSVESEEAVEDLDLLGTGTFTHSYTSDLLELLLQDLYDELLDE
jgi:hypothetical protein